METIIFSENELKIVEEIPPARLGRPVIPLYNFPVAPGEAYRRGLKKAPLWQLTGVEKMTFCPDIIPDNLARGFIIQELPVSPDTYGGPDMFGVLWHYNPENRGSAVDPSYHLFTDANEWRDKLIWPDVESWDWKETAEKNKDFLADDRAVFTTIFSGYFERLISFMDFGNASIALIDDTQKEAVLELFEKLTDLYIQIVDHFIDYFHADGFLVHDDWGSQRGPLFSEEACEEMIVPAMKRLTDHIHSRGRIAEFHSCGLLDMRVPSIINAGWDVWSPQIINDTHKIYEEYGDQLVVGVIPESYDSETPETLKQSARDFVEKFCDPCKPALMNHVVNTMLPGSFREELYKLSRIKFQKA